MKIYLHLSKNKFAMPVVRGTLCLLVFAVCFANVLYAGIKPVYTKGGHIITRPHLKADALIMGKGNIMTLPTLTYNTATPQTYTVNTPVTITPVSTGVSAPGYSAPTTFASGFSVPYRVAFDAAGNAYVSDAGVGFVVKIPIGGGARVNLGTGLVGPAGVAVDAAGANVYVANLFGGTVSKIAVSSNTTTTIGPKFADPYAVAVDAAGNVYVGDGQATSIKEIKAGTNTTVDVGSGFSGPTGVAVDAAGNVYVADQTNNAVKKVTPGGVITSLGTGFSAPDDVAVDANGNVYVADLDNNEIKEIPVAGGAPVNVLAFPSPASVTVDGSGIVYFGTNSATNTAVQEVKPGGGYYINKALPAGLSFSNTTGVISGTPTVAGPAKNYDITAYNSSGSVSASIDMQITSNVNLSALVLSSGPLTPAFAAGTTNYTASVLNAVSSVTLTPTVSDVTSTVKVNGTAVASGSASASLPLNVGPNTISTVVTGSDGTTKQTYTITVNRGAVIPIFSYNSPQSYNAGAPITPLTPTASNVAAPGYSSTPVILGGGAVINSPVGLAMDAAGNIFVTGYGDGTIEKIPVGGGNAVQIISGLSNPTGVAVDAAGNLYVSNSGNNTVLKIASGSNTPVVIGTGFHNPDGVAVDAAGNLYVADEASGSIKKILAGTNTTNIIAQGFGGPFGLALDAAGNIYVADNGANVIREIPVGGGVGSTISLGSGFSTPYAVTVDPAGNVYVCDQNATVIKKIPVGNGAVTTLGTGFSIPRGVVVDPYGNVYVADENNHEVKEITPVGGYYLGNPLPPGLSINNTTGVISGTPSAGPIAAANYMVTAYNANGGSTTTVNLKINNSPTPVLHYAGPQTYHAGTAIAALTPTNTGLPVAAPAYAASKVILTGLNGPQGVAVDNNSGDIYIAGDGGLQKLPAGGGAAITIPGFTTPAGVAVDAAGNVYVATYSGGTVDKIPAGTNTIITLASGLSAPTGVAVDGTGNVYFSEYQGADIKKIPAGGGTPVVVATGIGDAESVAVDAAGNVYAISQLATTVTKIAAGSGTVTQLGSGFLNPTGVAVDASGNLFVGDSGNSRVMEIPAGSNTPILVANGFNRPYGVAIDGAGNVYATDIASSVLRENTPVGGSYIWPFLPPGLSFNNTTGVISGTPTVGSPPTNYTITSYNNFGAGTATVNIRVNTTGSVASLANLAISSGILTPAFATATTSYTATVANTVSSITITPTSTDPNADIKVNGAEVVSGAASASLALAVGANTITTMVTAQDGATIKTYTLTVTRGGALSNDALLTSIKLAPASTLTVVTGPSYVNYTTTVAATTNSVTVTATEQDPTATLKVNGVTTTPGTVSAPITLVTGSNVINVVSTAQDGVTTKTYTITATKPASNLSTDALLTSIKLTPASTLTVVTGPSYVNYTTTVAATTNSITVTATEQDPTATLKVNGVVTTPGTASTSIPLKAGSNTITIVSTAQDGKTTKTYTITATKAASANLSALKLSVGVLSPAFVAATTSYTATETNATTSVTVTPTAGDGTATIKVNGTAVASGAASAAIPLTVGLNAITAVVTDGSATLTYTIKVTRAASTDALLTSIKLTPASALTIVTGPSYVNYTTSVPNATTSVKVTATEQDLTATIKVNGTVTSSGTASAAIPLAVGSNTINIVSTAQDGTTTKTYTITATRAAAPGTNNPDEALSVTRPNNSPTIADDGIIVHQGISPNGDGINDYLTIDNIANYPNNNLMIMDRNGVTVYQTKGYGNSSKLFDGHSNISGKMQLPGTYFYTLDYAVNGETKHKTGFIILKY